MKSRASLPQWHLSPMELGERSAATFSFRGGPEYGSTIELWAHRVLALRSVPFDPKTLDEWAGTVHVSRGALRACCHSAGVSPRVSLDLGRLLRAVSRSVATGWSAESFLRVSDPRSITALVRRMGLHDLRGMTPEQLLADQQVLAPTGPHLESIRRGLAASPVTCNGSHP